MEEEVLKILGEDKPLPDTFTASKERERRLMSGEVPTVPESDPLDKVPAVELPPQVPEKTPPTVPVCFKIPGVTSFKCRAVDVQVDPKCVVILTGADHTIEFEFGADVILDVKGKTYRVLAANKPMRLFQTPWMMTIFFREEQEHSND